MNSFLKILMAQLNFKVGAIETNAEKIISVIVQEQSDHDVIVFPELAVTGYPPEDLLLRKEFHLRVQHALNEIQAASDNCHIVVGHTSWEDGHCFNSASVFYRGKRIALYHKQNLPNYGVFDEQRYFTPGDSKACVLTIKGYRLGLCICEDLWQAGPIETIIATNIDVLLCLNASPFDYEKPERRENLLRSYAKQGITIIYVNLIGGQDELVFDGQSLAMDYQGTVCGQAPAFVEHLQSLTLDGKTLKSTLSPPLEQNQLIYKALVCATRDYVEKNGFSGVLLGLSGGIDSALTLAIAVDALGASRVHAVLMPSRYTAQISNEDALIQLQRLNVEYSILPIEPIFNSYMSTLAPLFKNLAPDTTEENLQARIRGMLLMALSNKSGKMVLTTSNKSETAVGYATLYGDMAGGFAVLKDVLKTQVYALANYRNSIEPIIPERVITRAPSAELAENQTDQDSLPAYEILDAIIKAYMENNLATDDIIAQGYSPADVHKVLRLIKQNEYKRRQAAPGIKISSRAFGKDWRLPITSGF